MLATAADSVVIAAQSILASSIFALVICALEMVAMSAASDSICAHSMFALIMFAVLYRGFFAKYAETFFRKSFSASSSRTRRLSC